MKRTIITSVTSKVFLPEASFEKYLNSHRIRNTTSMKAEKSVSFSKDFETIGTCSTPATVNGVVLIKFASGRNRNTMAIEIPVTTSFLVTCTKSSLGKYRFGFYVSMS
jgi:hypothetical protein